MHVHREQVAGVMGGNGDTEWRRVYLARTSRDSVECRRKACETGDETILRSPEVYKNSAEMGDIRDS